MWNDLIERRPELAVCEQEIKHALDIIIKCYERGGKLLLCGNGGSAADCEHIVGELMKDFLVWRPLSEQERAQMRERVPSITDEMLDCLQRGLPAISLPSIIGFGTAFSNDRDAQLVYAQGVLTLANEADVLLAISTSGNAANVIYAAEVAGGLGLPVIGLTGNSSCPGLSGVQHRSRRCRRHKKSRSMTKRHTPSAAAGFRRKAGRL